MTPIALRSSKKSSKNHEPIEKNTHTRSKSSTHLTEAIHETTVSGHDYPVFVKQYAQSKLSPTSLDWILKSQQCFYSGLFDKSAERFFSGSSNGLVRIFDCSQYFLRLVAEIPCPLSFWSVVSLDLSPDERHLAYTILSDQIILVSLEQYPDKLPIVILGENLILPSTSRTFCVCFDGSGKRIFCGHDLGILGIYDLEHSAAVSISAGPTLRDVNVVETMDSSGHIILTGSDDSGIRLFDTRVSNDQALAVFTGHQDGITSLDAKADERYFLSNSKDQTVRLWDIRLHCNRNTTLRPKLQWDYRVHSIPRIYSNPRYAESKDSRGDLSVLTLRGHTVRYTLIRARFSPIHSTGQRYAYAGSSREGWCMWDLSTGELVHRNKYRPDRAGFSNTVRDVNWHPWEPVVYASELSGSLCCWTDPCRSDVNSSTCGRERLVQLDPDGKRFRTSLRDSQMRFEFPGEDPVDESMSTSDEMLPMSPSVDISASSDEDESDDAGVTTTGYQRWMNSDFTSDDDGADVDYIPLDVSGDRGDHHHVPITRSQSWRHRRNAR